MKIEPKIMSQVKSILGKFGNKYLASEGSLKRNNVINDLDKFDHELMTKLFKDPLIHKNYVEKIADTEVFKLNQFIEMFEYKEFWEDSYTKYTNKIGLTANGKFIDESADVVLDFPFKDTVLKAGMTKEDLDKDASIDEPFLNETIAKPEIDELLEPKIFVNARKYDQNGEHKTSNYSNHDNLIIKGNNLIALHSIENRYAGKIKMVYLDPPYNTGSDSFEYNDQFSRSAWLTFIKNRVEIAKKLLTNDGVILIQTSFHQYPYLRVLLDNILGEDCHQFDLNVLVRHPDRALTADKPFNDVMEYTLIYSRQNDFQMPRKIEKKTPDKYDRVVTVADHQDEVLELGNKKVDVFLPEHTDIKKVEPATDNLHRETIRGSIREKNSSGRFYVAYLENLRGKYPPRTIFRVPDMGDDSLGYRYFELPKSSKIKNGAYYQGMPTSSDVTKKPYPNFINMVETYNQANNQGTYSFRNGKKPEEFIQYLINIFTNEHDIVLDFFMGSATTQAVALKMHRRFIGIEQMNYINTVSVPRLQSVINGEQGGISKDVNWQGGGSFVYAELMEKNQGYLKDLLAAKDMNELDIVYKRMKLGADFDFRVDLDKYENDAERKALPFEEQKQLLVKLLDKNQLYYNFNNIDDADVRDLISDKDYQFNQSFYGKRD
ncbi:DNA methyltransferase [Pediococcus pentosaceus]|uniref:DNA methyltransferase n=1 Tax=Pediococcus pentosaceus TaxID=1255 RepID=UPI002074A7EA|nr:site-specific DNA-methyltransferase [Pediococcus pentosaceus]MCM6819319.1 site-specific DNA-methyltransferase [Pediococcus pentosaceus]